MKIISFIYCWILLAFFSKAQITLLSPNHSFSLSFELSSNGIPSYALHYQGNEIIKNSTLGIRLKNTPSLIEEFQLIATHTRTENSRWKPVWGEVSEITNHYNELAVHLKQHSTQREMFLRFRLFNEGLAFRYEFPMQPYLNYFVVEEELTQFRLTDDHKAFWIPGDYDTNEFGYTISPLSKVNAFNVKTLQEIGNRKTIAPNVVQTPLLMKTATGIYISIFEAALVNYSAMHLTIDQKNFTLSSHLVPDAVGGKAYLQTPCHTPWRTIIISEKAADILTSKMILNLNEPCKLEDTSWIKPQKIIGIWWEMHVGKATWNYADTNNIKLNIVDWKKLKPNGKHGATTERTMYYIDFAAKHGFDGVLVEGWNVGWEDWIGNWKEEVFDFVTPYPDFDIDKLQRYAQEKGVKLIMHHETSGSVTNYERRLDEALRFMKEKGYQTVKTGYVGRIIPRGEYHDGQWMVNHYIRVAEKMASHQIMLDAHEAVRPTGLHRTYPNWLACESARGNEFNAWSSGNDPDHETILPFTRLLGGPMDYTPGIFQIKLDYYQSGKKEAIHTTLAKQLALYVTMYSPLQMAADLPENYERFPDAFQFIKDVALDWDDTKVLEAEPGDFITIARKTKGKEEWFIGAITDENRRIAVCNMNFLLPDVIYLATIYSDAPDAHWDRNPMAYQINHFLVTRQTVLAIPLAEGGGAAVTLRPATIIQQKQYKFYKNKFR